MLCTRCQQREAIAGPSPEARAKSEAMFGAPWPFPDVCKECLRDLAKTPEFRERLHTLSQAVNAKFRENLDKTVRSAALKVLDFADNIAGRI